MSPELALRDLPAVCSTLAVSAISSSLLEQLKKESGEKESKVRKAASEKPSGGLAHASKKKRTGPQIGRPKKGRNQQLTRSDSAALEDKCAILPPTSDEKAGVGVRPTVGDTGDSGHHIWVLVREPCIRHQLDSTRLVAIVGGVPCSACRFGDSFTSSVCLPWGGGKCEHSGGMQSSLDHGRHAHMARVCSLVSLGVVYVSASVCHGNESP